MLDRARTSLRSLREKGAFYILVGTFLTKAAAFLGSIVLVRVMLVEEYGVLSYMENLYTYAYIFAGYGLNNAVFRYVVLKDEVGQKRGVFDYVVTRGTAFNIAFVAILSIAAFFGPHHQEFSVAAYLLPLMLVAVPLQFLYESGSLTLRAFFKNKAYAIFGVACIIVVYAARVGGAAAFGLTGATLSWPIAYVVMCMLVIVFVRKSLFKGEPAQEVSKVDRRAMTTYSVQYMITNGLWALFMQNDILLLGMLTADPTTVAMYKVAYVIPAAVNLFSSSIGIFVAPYFVKNENDKPWVWKNYKRVLGASIALIGAACAAIALFAEPLVLFIYGQDYAPAIGLMQVLLLSAFVNNAVRYTAANLLAAMGRIRVNLVVSIVGIIVQVALDIALIPMLGAYGAAYASIAVYALMAIIVTGFFVWFYRK